MSKLIIWILIPIAIFVTTILVILIYLAWTKKAKEKSIELLKKSINIESIPKLESILSRVKIISKDNDKYKMHYKKLKVTHEHIEIEMNFVINLFNKLKENVNETKKRDFISNVNETKKRIISLDALRENFNSIAEGIIQQDDFMSSEISFYKSNLRKVILIYKEKKPLLDKISPKIDNLSNEIKKLGHDFNKSLDAADLVKASKELKEYVKNVLLFSEIINYGPSIQTYLYSTIPKTIKSLLGKFKYKNIKISGTLEHVNFKDNIRVIYEKFSEAKKMYLNLNVFDAKDSIINILKSLKNLDKLVDVEIKSMNMFAMLYEKAIIKSNENINNFIEIKKRLEEISKRNIKIPNELSEIYKYAVNDIKQLKNNTDKFNHIITKNILFSIKLSKMKFLFKQNEVFVRILNEMNVHIWKLNTKGLVIKNRLNKIKLVLNELTIKRKELDLIFTKEEKNNLKIISNGLSELTEVATTDLQSKDLFENSYKLMIKTTSFYKIIGKKIHISKIVRNLIKEFGPKRGINLNLNSAFNVAETSYLKGEYEIALSTIVTCLEEERTLS